MRTDSCPSSEAAIGLAITQVSQTNYGKKSPAKLPSTCQAAGPHRLLTTFPKRARAASQLSLIFPLVKTSFRCTPPGFPYTHIETTNEHLLSRRQPDPLAETQATCCSISAAQCSISYLHCACHAVAAAPPSFPSYSLSPLPSSPFSCFLFIQFWKPDCNTYHGDLRDNSLILNGNA